MSFKLSFGIVACFLAVLGGCSQYSGFKVYDITPTNEFQVETLYNLSLTSDKLDFWSLSRLPGELVRVMVSPELQPTFEDALKEFDLKFIISIEDVSQMVKSEQSENFQGRSIGLSFSRYLRYHEVNAYLDSLAQRYPDRVIVDVAGYSSERRPIKTITISNGIKRAGKKVIFVDAGIHAREWIAPAGALYIIHQLVENFEVNKHHLENFDWIILPVVNPDGYEYTHTKSRMWRKTRSSNGVCSGTDANRNFDFHWAEVGTSTSSCADTFHGNQAFSEPESRVIRDILLILKGRCKFYLTLHSFGSYLLYPWGYTSALPDTWRDLDEVAQAGARAMKAATGAVYKVGSSTNVLYAAAGGSDDYAFAIAKVPIAMTMELPAGGVGFAGFDPKPHQILGMVQETWIGIKAMAEKVNQKYA